MTIYGVSIGLIVRGALGLSPWDVLHAGVLLHVNATFGVVVMVIGAAALLLWIPLREKPGVGTVANILLVGVSIDATLAVLDEPVTVSGQVTFLMTGIVLNGVAGALYLGTHLGPSARDGLMTGLARLTGLSLRLVRTTVELIALTTGLLLGGPLAIGTLVYALSIGPLVQFFMPFCSVCLPGSPDPDS
ncbi:MAG: hypothetical protein Q8Q02_15095 [Nocardioides sp.]|nr:hypothetical protein [Nocardioides sp.]